MARLGNDSYPDSLAHRLPYWPGCDWPVRPPSGQVHGVVRACFWRAPFQSRIHWWTATQSNNELLFFFLALLRRPAPETPTASIPPGRPAPDGRGCSQHLCSGAVGPRDGEGGHPALILSVQWMGASSDRGRPRPNRQETVCGSSLVKPARGRWGSRSLPIWGPGFGLCRRPLAGVVAVSKRMPWPSWLGEHQLMCRGRRSPLAFDPPRRVHLT